MKLGTQDVTRLMVGSSFAKEARLGTDKVYSIFKDPVSALFFRRQTAGGAVTNPALPQYGKALLSTIKGNSMVWNQLVDTSSLKASGSYNGITFAYADGVITAVSGTATGITFSDVALGHINISLVKGHQYFLGYGGGTEGKRIQIFSGNAGNKEYTTHNATSLIFTCENDVTDWEIRVRIAGGTTVNNDKFTFNLVDLTLLFNGAVPAGYTVADFERDYPLNYYGYNPGQIIDLKGARLWWNQLVNPGSISTGNMSLDNDVYTVINTGRDTFMYFPNVTPVVGHIYYFAVECFVPFGVTTEYGFPNSDSNVKALVNGRNSWRVEYVSGNLVFDDKYRSSYAGTKFQRCMLVDLTAMYGAGNEPTLQDFEAQFDADYYPYNAGEWINRAFLETVGFNQWDEEWEHGAFTRSGEPRDPSLNPDWIRSVNFNPALPNTQYYKQNGGKIIYFLQYDANKNYIGAISPANMTTDAHAAFFKLQIQATTYNHDICINLSNATKNGTYEPYWKSTKNLGLDDIRVSSPNVWDEEWEEGLYETGNGQKSVASNRLRSANKIEVLPNTAYYFKFPSGYSMRILYYDAEGNYLSYQETAANTTITIGTQCRKIAFCLVNGNTTTYNHDICINLSDPSLNGKYFPRRVPGLAKAGNVYDEMSNTSVKRRLGKYIITGSETFNRDSISVGAVFLVISNITQDLSTGKVVSSAYIQSYAPQSVNQADKSIRITAGTAVCIRDTSKLTTGMTDAQVGAALKGLEIIYELATPEEYDLETPMDAEYRMDYLGTEALIPENSSTPSTAKFSAEIKYPK